MLESSFSGSRQKWESEVIDKLKGTVDWSFEDLYGSILGSDQPFAGLGQAYTGKFQIILPEESDLFASPLCVPEGSKGLDDSLSSFHFSPNYQHRSMDEVSALKGITKDTKVFSGFDPFSWSLSQGKIREDLAESWAYISAQKDNVSCSYSPVKLSTWTYANSGVGVTEELGILLASIVSVIRSLEEQGIEPKESCKWLSFELSVGTEQFFDIAKLQAFRLLWRSLQEHMGVTAERSSVFARQGLYNLASRDPWSNMIRQTISAFSAIIGEADGVRLYPFDVFHKKPTTWGWRSARNVCLTLLHESKLQGYSSAAEGNLLLQEMLPLICRKSWQFFQDIESKGGLIAALNAGWIQGATKRDKKETDLVGISRYVLQGEGLASYQPPPREDVFRIDDLLPAVDFSSGSLRDVRPFAAEKLGSNWEDKQFLSDQKFRDSGAPQKVFLLQDGDRKGQFPRWQWFKNYFDKRAIQVCVFGTGDPMPESCSVLFVLGDDPSETRVTDWLSVNVGKETKVSWVGRVSNPDEFTFDDQFHKGVEDDNKWESLWR